MYACCGREGRGLVSTLSSDERAESEGSVLLMPMADPERCDTVGNEGLEGGVSVGVECPEEVRRVLPIACMVGCWVVVREAMRGELCADSLVCSRVIAMRVAAAVDSGPYGFVIVELSM